MKKKEGKIVPEETRTQVLQVITHTYKLKNYAKDEKIKMSLMGFELGSSRLLLKNCNFT